MNWQLLLAGVIILAATAYLVRQSWRTWFGAKSGCGGGCACHSKKSAAPADAPSTTIIPAHELTRRIRSQS